MNYTSVFYTGPGSKIFGTLRASIEDSSLTHLPNATYIEKETYFLCNNLPTVSSRPEKWRIWIDANYTSKSTPSPTSTMGMSPNLTKGTMVATKMNFIKPPTHGLLMDTQYQNNGNCGVRPSENSPQVIITEPIFKNLVNGQITSKKLDMFPSSVIT